MSKREKPNFEAYPDLPRQINETQLAKQRLPRGLKNHLITCGPDINALPLPMLQHMETYKMAKQSERYGWVLTERGKQIQKWLKDLQRGRN